MYKSLFLLASDFLMTFVFEDRCKCTNRNSKSNKQNKLEKTYFLVSWKSLTKRAGSGSINQVYIRCTVQLSLGSKEYQTRNVVQGTCAELIYVKTPENPPRCTEAVTSPDYPLFVLSWKFNHFTLNTDLCSLRSLMGFLDVQLVLGVPDRLVVPDRVSLVQLKRLLDDTSARQWNHLHQV
jgi:hypothetical protein